MTMRRRSSSPNTPTSDSSPSSSDLPLVAPIPNVDGAKEYDEARLFRTYINDSAFDSITPVVQPASTAYDRLPGVLPSAPQYHVPPPAHVVKLPALPPPTEDEPTADEPAEQEPEGKPGPDVQVVRPPKENCVNLPIRVRNVPLQGAKSRVETQLKVTIDLVWDPAPRSHHFHHASSSSSGNSADSKDELAPTVGSWEWLALPPGSATKRRGRKEAKIVPTPAQTLTLHTMVHVASAPHTAARACKKCLAREAKRAERKRRGPNDPAPCEIQDLASLGCEDDKIVLYNCADVLDFRSGSVDLPVRLTCYCRHHSEKVGFCITFTLRDHSGRTVGTGVTPPIMITDDHKSTARKVQAQQSAAPGAGLVPPTATAAVPGLVPAPSANAASGGTRKGSKDKSGSGAKHRMKPYERSTVTSRASSIGLVGVVKEEAVNGHGINGHGASNFTPASNYPGSANGASNYATPSTQGFASPPPQSPTLFQGMFGMQGALLGDGTVLGDAGMIPPSSATLLSPTRSAFLSPPRSPVNSRTHTRAHSPVQMIPTTPAHTSTSIHSPAHTTLHSPVHTTVHSRAHSPVRGILSPQTSVHSLPGGGMTNEMLMESLLADGVMAGDTLLGGTGDGLLMGGEAAMLGLDNDALMANPFAGPNGQMFDPSFDPAGPGGATIDPSNVEWEAMLQSLTVPQAQAARSASSGAMYVEHPANGPFSNASWETSAPSTAPWAPEAMELSPPETAPIPRISRVVPNSGPIQGGIEVTLLGENFTRAYECKFGEYVATETALWGGNTLVCLLPPAAQAGAVPVCIKGYENAKRPGERDVLFTYRDDSVDRSLMELALRVVGQRMTGRQEEPCNIARRIVAVGEMQSNSNGLATRLAQSVIESDAAQPEEPSPSRQEELIQFLTLLDVPNVGSRAVSTSAAVSLQNETEHTLLHLCAVLGFDALATDLLRRGADPDIRDATGQTALHLAALRGQVACARVLLEAGADTEIVNAYGMAPIDVARERGSLEVLALLEGADQESTEGEEESDVVEEVGLQPLSPDDSVGADADESDLDAEEGELRTRVLAESEEDIVSSGSEDASDGLYADQSSRPSLDSITDGRPPFLGEIPKVPSTWFHRTFSQLQPQKAWPLPQINLPDMPTLPAWPVTIPWPQTPEKGTFDLGAFRGFLGNKQQQANAGVTMYPPPPQPTGTENTQGLNQVQLRARLARRLGYYPTEVTDREIRAYTHHSQKMTKLKKDRMLVLFWLPILLIVIAWGLYQSVPMALNVVANKVRGLLPLANH